MPASGTAGSILSSMGAGTRPGAGQALGKQSASDSQDAAVGEELTNHASAEKIRI